MLKMNGEAHRTHLCVELDSGERRCAKVAGEAIIRDPARSRLDHKPQVAKTSEVTVPYAHQP